MRLPSLKDDVLIMDTGADCNLLSIRAWHVFHETGSTVDLGTRFSEMRAMDVVHAATVVTLENGQQYILLVYNGLLDRNPEENESMLLPHDARAHGVIIDDVSTEHFHADGTHGKQCAIVEGTELPFHFDEKMMYWCISKPTPDQLESLPLLELTSPEIPSHLLRDMVPAIHRGMKVQPGKSLDRWRKCLA